MVVGCGSFPAAFIVVSAQLSLTDFPRVYSAAYVAVIRTPRFASNYITTCMHKNNFTAAQAPWMCLTSPKACMWAAAKQVETFRAGHERPAQSR